ncbi:MAG: hypothetical protein ACP5P4_14625 [Steroidobacteraceae bacterium]
MPTPPSRAPRLCAAALAAALSGCSAAPLRLAPPAHAPHLSGNWRLDAAHSEPIDAAVTLLQTQLHARMLKALRAMKRAQGRAQTQSGPPPGRDHEQGGSSAPIRDSGHTVQEPGVEVSAPMFGAAWVGELIGHVPVGSILSLALSPGEFSLTSADGVQQCSLGIPTVIAFGPHDTANQSCGWRGRAFIIELEPLLGPKLSEQFAIAPGGELVMTLHLSGHGVNVSLVRRYRRTTQGPPQTLLPTSD